MQAESVAAPQSAEARRPHLSDSRDAGMVDIRMTIPVMPDARKEL